MRNKPILIVLGALVFLAGAPIAWSQKTSTPAGVTDTFYRKYIAFQMRGLPTVKQATSLAPLFSKDIMALIASARAEQKQFIKEHPEDKPPWIEGDLFTSLWEGATSYSIGKARVGKTTAEVDVHLMSKDKDQTTEWIDTVELMKTNGRWVIRDIQFKGNWAFMNGSSLSAALR